MKKIAIVLIAMLALSGCSQMNQREVTFTVEDKERVCDANNDCKYLIFTDQGTFQNTDSLLEGKFDSSDIYGRFKEGETYTVLVGGYRQPVFSMYPNILEIKS